MKPIKILFAGIFILMAAVLTAPLWGGCGFNYTLCTTWCEIRHMNSSLETAACKGACSAEQLACFAK